MASPEPESLVDLLTRRGALLRRLDGEGKRRADLVAETGLSRSTVDRGVRELAEAGLACRDDGRCRQTLAGELALSAYDDLLETFDALAAASPALAELSPGFPFDASLLSDPSVAVASHPDPGRPARVQRRIVERATHQRALAATALPSHVDVYHRAITEGDLSGEFVVSPRVLELLVDHGEQLEAALDTGRVSLRVAEDLPPYGLSVSETPDGSVVGALVYRTAGPDTFLSVTDDDAVAWAEGLIERHWREADPVPC